ncbi:hypothetical protein HDU93_006441, partial [Gonapodya sp. JEL0774]
LFLSSSLALHLSKLSRRSLRPLFYPPSPYARFLPLYHLLTWFATLSFINYVAMGFVLLEWDATIAGMRNVGWAGHVAVVGWWAVLEVGGVGRWLKGVQKGFGAGVKGKTVDGGGSVDARSGNGTTLTHGDGRPANGAIKLGRVSLHDDHPVAELRDRTGRRYDDGALGDRAVVKGSADAA